MRFLETLAYEAEEIVLADVDHLTSLAKMEIGKRVLAGTCKSLVILWKRMKNEHVEALQQV